MLAAPLAVGVALAFGFDPVAHATADPLIHRQGGFVGSEACRPCHLEQHASWARTFHRTMTQEASGDAILGAFDGRAVAWQGRVGRPRRDGDAFVMDLPTPDGATRRAVVALAVGSRRYQQYFERDDAAGAAVYRRLPLVWHIEAGRWVHVATIFLGPDDPSWDSHAARWNENCVFCHNTAPRPGLIDWKEHRYRSQVGELGIACESCHGPGAEHAAKHRSLIERYATYLRGGADPSVVNPARLDRERSVGVCGQCHGQRVPNPRDATWRWLTTGPTFRSGSVLTDYVEPVRRDTPSPKDDAPDLFRVRFWGDGTPRLTAYEYQGLTASECYLKGTLTCVSCHDMHGGDPRGMIDPAKRGDGACLPCHRDLFADLTKHTHHKPEGSGSRCLECHMPKIVYGITTVHRSHRIDNPVPASDAATGRPDACTLCHVDRTPAWAAEQVALLWKRPLRPVTSRVDRAPLDLPDAAASLLAGDVVQRAVWAYAAGRPEVAPTKDAKAAVRGPLVVTLADGYPAVRWLAQRSLAALEAERSDGLEDLLGSYDHMASRDDHAAAARAMLRRLQARGVPVPPLDTIGRLTDLQSTRVISIGE